MKALHSVLSVLVFFYASQSWANDFIQCGKNLHAVETIKIPSIGGEIAISSPEKVKFTEKLARISQKLFHDTRRSAIAPMGGTKVAPFSELDLDELVIVGNLYPGTPDEIRSAFTTHAEDIREIVNKAKATGSFSSGDMVKLPAGAQVLARLKYELGVNKVEISYVSRKSGTPLSAWAMREMKDSEGEIATLFDFELGGRRRRLSLVSGFVLSDSASGTRSAFPPITRDLVPSRGASWIYLSADGVGFFSKDLENGLQRANQESLDLLVPEGAVVLDYPTGRDFTSVPQTGFGITFMMGRRPLEAVGLKRVASIPTEKTGVFGYCLKPGDEVRVYQKSSDVKSNPPKRPVGQQLNFGKDHKTYVYEFES